MANKDHLAILKLGVNAWNKWRKSTPSIKPDLSQAILRNLDLSEVNLIEATLNRANLAGANLIRANLRGAKLLGADLSDAVLDGAKLEGVKYLTREQLDKAMTNDKTILPDYLHKN